MIDSSNPDETPKVNQQVTTGGVSIPDYIPRHDMYVKNCDCHTADVVHAAFCIHLGMHPFKAERKMWEIHNKGIAYVGTFDRETCEHYRHQLVNRAPGMRGEPMDMEFIPPLPEIDNSDLS